MALFSAHVRGVHYGTCSLFDRCGFGVRFAVLMFISIQLFLQVKCFESLDLIPLDDELGPVNGPPLNGKVVSRPCIHAYEVVLALSGLSFGDSGIIICSCHLKLTRCFLRARLTTSSWTKGG